MDELLDQLKDLHPEDRDRALAAMVILMVVMAGELVRCNARLVVAKVPYPLPFTGS